MADLETKLKGVVGDTLVSAASIAYLAVFTAPYRKAMIQTWWNACKEKAIPVSEGYTLVGAMTEPNTVSILGFLFNNLVIGTQTYSTLKDFA